MKMFIPAALNAVLAAANIWAFYSLGRNWWNFAVSVSCALFAGFSIGVAMERLFPFIGAAR